MRASGANASDQIVAIAAAASTLTSSHRSRAEPAGTRRTNDGGDGSRARPSHRPLSSVHFSCGKLDAGRSAPGGATTSSSTAPAPPTDVTAHRHSAD